MYRRPPHWTSTPTSRRTCRRKRRPKSTGDWGTRYRRKSPSRSRRRWPTSSLWAGRSADPGQGASPRSTTTSLRDGTPRCGRMGSGMRRMYTLQLGKRWGEAERAHQGDADRAKAAPGPDAGDHAAGSAYQKAAADLGVHEISSQRDQLQYHRGWGRGEPAYGSQVVWDDKGDAWLSVVLDGCGWYQKMILTTSWP